MDTRRHTSLTFLTLLPFLALPAAAGAQELTGTYVSYVDTSATGSLVRGTHSIAYAEAGGGGACDVFCQGSYEEGYSLEASGSLGDTLSANVTTDTSTGVSSLSGPLASGRTLTWSGSVASGSASLRIDQTVTYLTSDRAVGITVTLRNTGTESLTDLYYLRGGDPDQGYCGASDYTTVNDVVRQPPATTSALVTASAGGVVVGLGSFDSRARADVSAFGLDSPTTRWSAPTDPGGTSGDVAIALVFHVASLAAGASTTLQMYYVFASTAATLATRFDALRGSTPTCSEGASCAVLGSAGVCHASACCTGCWDGFSCQTGTSTGACGAAGGACATCDDGLSCTVDSCTAGACSAAVEGGCLIAGVCAASGETSPTSACRVCDPTRSTTTWSEVPSCGGTDAGPHGEDLGVPGEDLGVPGDDAGILHGDDGGTSMGDAGSMGGDGSAEPPPVRGRRRGGCDVGAVGASESGGVLALAMLMLVTLVRRRPRGDVSEA